jgi:hypothetical protein
MRERFIITLCIGIATLVFFSSIHSAQLFGAAFAPSDAKSAAAHDDGLSLHKITSELHHHSDQSGSQLIKDGGDQLYADSRTLRLLRHKRTLSLRDRLQADWLRALNELQHLHNA